MKNTKTQVVVDVISDFEARREARRPFELQWQLNIDYLHGRQNNVINSHEMVATAGKRFWWQNSEVFNHIAPLVESRLAKLVNTTEVINVIPLGDGERERECATKCEKIIKSAFKKTNMKDLVDQANMWAEMTGTSFYKVVWDNNKGCCVGEVCEEGKPRPVFMGDVTIVACSPFEVYPDSLTAGDVGQLSSIIHARPFTTENVKRIWGVDVVGESIEVHDLNLGGKVERVDDAVMVIERYKDGELVIVAGDKLVYQGAYDELPFVRQTSESVPGCFFGKSVIERAIPVQRAYNAVKNRKMEFINRLSCGVLAVEQGSVDVESLENEGLAPGAIIEYRNGGKEPTFLSGHEIPEALAVEEDKLLSELATITGGSDISRGDFSNVSGVALEIMVAQDRLRIRRAQVSGQNARGQVAQMVLRLYRKWASEARIDRLVNGKLVEVFSWSGKDITSDDVEVGNE